MLIRSSEVMGLLGFKPEAKSYFHRMVRQGRLPPPQIPGGRGSDAYWSKADVERYLEARIAQPLYIREPSFQYLSQEDLAKILKISLRTLSRRLNDGRLPLPRIQALAGRPPANGKAVAQFVSDNNYWHMADISRWIDGLGWACHPMADRWERRFWALFRWRHRRRGQLAIAQPLHGERIEFFLELGGLTQCLDGRVVSPSIRHDGQVLEYDIPDTVTVSYVLAGMSRETQIPLWRVVVREQ